MSLQFFIADDGSDGQELWVTNGTSAGTFLLRDINPGLGGSNVGNLVQSNGVMYFTAYDGSAYHLWRSDGTTAGTYQLSTATNGDNATNLIDVNGTLFYLGSDPTHGAGLFKTDGTVGGTTFVQNVSNTSNFIAVGNTLFFQAYDATNGYELWKSDGTTAGTTIVKDIMPGGGSSSLGHFTVSGGKLYFTANDGTHGNELWVSDGTAAGTVLVKDLNPGLNNNADPANLFSDGTHLFFTANDGAHGTQLYVTDGTTAGTTVLSVSGYATSTFTRFNNHGYFIANDSPSGRAIYTSDGTSVIKVQHLSSFSGVFYNLGDKLVFVGNDGTHGGGLYTFDGTTTTFVTATPAGFQQPVVSNGKLFFVAQDSAHGYELWVSDGTAAGTHLTADLNPGIYDANITNISAVGTGVVFSATRPDVGTELFFSDGTQAGTHLISDVNPTGDHSPSLGIGSNFFAAGGKGYFSANDGIHGYELWVGDGTTAGTHMITDLNVGANGSSPHDYYTVGGRMYFVANDGTNGTQLFTTDGTEAGTVRLTTDGVGGTPYDDASRFFTLNGHFYYLGYAPSATGGYSIYTTDGTSVTEVVHFPGGNTYQVPITLGSNVVMYASDGVHPTGLYSFDGTNLTFLDSVFDYQSFVVSGGNLFYRSYDGGAGSELWVTNGQVGGTHRVADINPGSYDSYPGNITSLGDGSVIFTAFNPSTGTEVYISDGTTTTLVDVNQTGDHSPSLGISSTFVGAGAERFFAANDGVHGTELWVSDANGTRMVTDLKVGASDSSPHDFYSVGGKFFFLANDGVNGTQLYTSDGTTETRLTTDGVGGTPYDDASRFFTLNGHFYYMGYAPSATGGYSIYTSDGTTVTEVYHFAGGNNYQVPVVLGANVVMYANDGVHPTGLYSFDGTNLTFLDQVNDYENITVSGGNLFYRSYDGGAGSELWVTNGQVGGTHRVADINPGSYDSYPGNITSLGNGSVIFTAYNPSTGTEVYISDGTTTSLVDINQTGDHGQSLGISSNVVGAGAERFFIGNDGVHGNELWVSDAGGTRMVTDLNVGANSSSPRNFYSVGGHFFFIANDGVNSNQLYTSDGTTVTRLTSDGVGGTPYDDASRFFTLNGHFYYLGYAPSATGGYSIYTSDGTTVTEVYHFPGGNNYQVPVVFGSSVVMYANDGVHPTGLYSFDGTNLSFVAAVNDYENITVSGGNLFYRSYDGGTGYELWVYDGSSAHRVADINPTGDSYPAQLTSLGNGSIVFTADDGVHGRELWVSNGQAGGTFMVADLFPDAQGSDPQSLVAIGTRVFFTANYFSNVDGAHGRELFVYDDTTHTATMVSDINAGSGSSNPGNLFVSNGTLFFSADDGIHGSRLYSTDGTTVTQIGTSDGSDDNNPGNFLAADATHFYFTGNSGLFYSDGTTAGTHRVIDTSGFDASKYAVIGGTLYFQHYDGTNGYELWTSDGTPGGTTRVTDTQIPNSSNAVSFLLVGSHVYFVADDGVHGRELWVSGGTPGTTHMLSDLNVGAGSSNPGNLFVSNGTLFFSADDGIHGSRLYSTDGTTITQIGTSDGSDDNNPGNFLAADATHFYFTGNSGLFYSDGTTAGTHRVIDTSGFDASKYAVVGGTLYFQHYDGTNGYELWTSDGTAAGTTRVTDTQIPNSSNASSFVLVGSQVYFIADDGVHGRELWVSGGTPGTTHLLSDINSNGAGGSNPSNLFVSNGKLFFSADDGIHGQQLYTTDGTTVTQIGTSDGSDNNNPGNFLSAGATHFYFTGNGGLFYSDGTAAGTHRVTDNSGFDASKYAVIGGILYFQHYDGTNGYELWKSDGTAAGTSRVTDTQIPNSSNPGNFAAIDNVPPTVTGTTTVSIGDNATTHPFATTVIADADTPVQTMTVTITLDDPAKGGFTAASLAATGVVAGGVAGSYTFTGTPAQATAALQALVFQPTNNHLVVGNSETTTFTVSVNDGHGGSVVDHTTTVTAISINDAPSPVADAVAVNEDAPASATHATGLLANDTDADVGETATLKVVGAHVGANADTSVAASGTTDIVGTYGTLHLAADGSYSYTPNSAAAEALAQGAAASDVFSYTVADVHGATTTSTLTFNITGQEDAPVAVADTVAVNEDALAQAATRAVGLLGNDADVDNGEQATLKVTGAHFGAVADTTVAASGTTDIVGTYGTLHLAADGTYTYTPNSAAAEALVQGAAASDVFSYTITDAQGVSSTSTVTFNVTGQNDTPAPVSDAVSVNEDVLAQATTRAAGVLGNDTDPDSGETATLKVVGAHVGANADTAVAASGTTDIVGTYGTLHLAANGTYTYTPNSAAAEALAQGAAASDVFSYTVADVHGATTASTLTFNITGQNDVPVAVADTVAVNEDALAQAATRGAGLLGNDSDVDTGETATLKVTGAHFGAVADTAVAASGTTDIVGTYGTLHLAADGTYSYTPNTAAAEALAQGAAASDVFSYTITDAQGATSTSNVTFNVTGQNDVPVAVAETVAVNEDAPASTSTRATGLLANDSDVDTGETATLKIVGAHVGASADTAVAASGTTDIVGAYGTLHLAADGTYSYTPNSAAAEALAQGAAASDVFSYTVADLHGATATTTLTFNITGQNDAPVAVADVVAVNEDALAQATTRAAGLLGNDTDVDTGEQATLKVTGAHFGGATDTTVAASGTTDIVGTYGTLHLAADGTYTYTPNTAAAEALAQGVAASDVFSYTITDAQGATSASTLTFNVTGQNDGPTAASDSVAVNEDAPASAASRAAGLLGNDTDPDTGETATLKVVGAHVGANADTTVAASGTTDIVGTYGTLHLAADGTYSYTPNSAAAEALAQGAAASDVFNYTVADVHGATTASTLTFNITGQNDAPVAVADTVAVNEDALGQASTRAAGLLGNDSDVDTGESATLKVTGAHVGTNADTAVAASGTTDIVGTYGTLHLAADGTYSYTPNSAAAQALAQGAAASDVFSYTITDAHGATTTSTLTFNVTGIDDPGVAVDDSNGTLENAAITGASVFGNDQDVDSTLTVGAVNGVAAAVGTQITLASGALLTLRADGTYDYDPNHAFDSLTGVVGATNHVTTDSFTYSLSDGSTATVTITITGVSTPGDQAQGTAGADTMTGSGNADYFNLSAGGDDTASGGDGNDAFYMGAAFTAADHIDGGAGTNDQIGLEGDYTGANRLILGANTIAGIEAIGLLAGHSYDLTTNDGNVASGQVLTVYAATLGAGDSFSFDGSAETDGSFKIYGGLGADNLKGGAGNDGFYFGRDGRFDPLTDHVDGGAGNNDQLALDGSYTVAISSANVTNVEMLVLLDGKPATHAQYHITLDNDWTAAGETHTVYGVQVRDGFTIDASAETDGNIRVLGGLGNDTITTGAGNDWIHGGAGADILDGGAGANTYAYAHIADSIGSSHDTIIHFDAAVDHIDLITPVTGIDAAINAGTLNASSFDDDLTAALAGLNANHAVQFTASSGDLAGHIFEVIDTNGIAGYQAGQDMVIELQNPTNPITDTSTFV